MVVIAFSVVAGSAAMLVGTIVSNPSQGGALGPAMGMLFGLIGGAMVPADVFPAFMRTLSHLTPHAWALDAFRTLSDPAAGITSILPELAVLVGFAVVLQGIAVRRFRQVLTR